MPMNRFASGRLIAVGLLLVGVVAAVAALATASGGDEDALVVYNGRSHYGGEAAFERLARETGIEGELFGGDASELYERLRNEGDGTRADVLVTVDAANLWEAKEAGLLARAPAPALARNVPAELRDPDGQWFAVSRRIRTLMRSTERVEDGELATYADLGDPRWKGRVCLRTSNNIYNQSLVADMLAKRGAPATERLLRSWMANEPRVLGSDVDVLEAIGAGQCDVGLTNHYYLGRMLEEDSEFPVAPVWVDQRGRGVHVNMSGVGITRHSDNVAVARELVEFLVSRDAQELFAETNSEFPANPDVP